MTDNPLKAQVAPSARVLAPTDKAERIQFWIDRGNRLLAGHEMTTKGDYISPRPGLRWNCINGNYFIEEWR